MKIARFAFPLMFVAGVLWLHLQPGFATVDMTKKEKTGCVTCHVKAKSKDLNDVGKCYQEKKDLKACQSK